VFRRFRPDHQIYLLIHIVLFIGGLAIAQIGGAILVAVGTSVSATGVCGWAIYFWIRFTDNSTQSLTRIRQLGIIDAFPARSVPIRPEYEKRFNAARERIDFLGFGLRALREDFGASFPAWVQHASIRVLLIDPDAPVSDFSYADQRDSEEGNSRGAIRNDVLQFLTFMQPFVNKHPDRLRIRLYSCLPALNVCRIDNEIFWGPYILGQQSRNTPTFLVNRAGAMYVILSDHYEEMWNNQNYSRDAYISSPNGKQLEPVIALRHYS
jgi:hypothetical protein